MRNADQHWPVAGLSLVALGLVRILAYTALVAGHGTALFQFSAKYLDPTAVIIAVTMSLAMIVAHWRDLGTLNGSALGMRGDSIFSKGVAFYIMMSFLGIELGKWTHDTEMRHFFLQSGYSVAFMYFISLTEMVAATALLLPRFRVYAGVILTTILIGAVFTHWRNGDALGDSRDALILLTICVSALVIEFIRGSRQTGDSVPA
jgi:uncharacterized membrane protein YphA (DoxX/SURF4 family)